MAGPKILVVTRRFWPFCDDACQRLLHFSASLQRAGGDLTILTARWHASWPEFSLCRAVPVHRLLPGPISSWNESHFQKNVVQWIAKRSAEFDCVYVDRADGLLSAILTKSSKWDMPVITRFSPADSGYGLDVGQRINQLAMAESCRRCAKVVCTSLSAHRLLVSQGIQDSRIIRISDPAWERIEWTAESKAMASHALFETCSDFVIPGRSSIILHLGLSEPKTLRAAIQTLCDLLDSGSMIRVWVVGSGLPPNSLYDLIKSRGWHREILLFDSFDDLQELIRVADLAVVSNPAETQQFTMPILAQAGVPMIVVDNSDCRAWFPEANHFQLCPATSQGFSAKIKDWSSNRERWLEAASSLRQLARRYNSSDEIAHRWLSIFRETLNESST